MIAFNRITWHAKSDTGLKRKINEDSFFVTDLSASSFDFERLGILFAVADSMGGHLGGEIAGKMACDSLTDYYSMLADQAQRPMSAETHRKTLVEFFYDIDKKISAHAKTNKACENMGTTLSALVLTAAKAIVSHVGDSRIYRLRGKELAQLTEDHNFVQEMIAEGELSPADAAGHPLRHLLTQAVGTTEPLYEVFNCIKNINPGDCFLLCSDGLHSMISDNAILETLYTNSDPVEAADRLVKLALGSGGKDNVTAIVVRV